MSVNHFSFEQHMEYSLILQTCYYRLEAFSRALTDVYGEEHEATQSAIQAMQAFSVLKIHMDDLVIQEFPERKLSCVYRTEGSSESSMSKKISS